MNVLWQILTFEWEPLILLWYFCRKPLFFQFFSFHLFSQTSNKFGLHEKLLAVHDASFFYVRIKEDFDDKRNVGPYDVEPVFKTNIQPF
jgi:hypothetical protein